MIGKLSFTCNGHPHWMNLSTLFNRPQLNSTVPSLLFIYHPRSTKRPGLVAGILTNLVRYIQTTTGHLALKWNSLVMPQADKVWVPSGMTDGYSFTRHSSSAVHFGGHLWIKQKILFHCDNTAVVDIWRKGSTRDPEIMALVCMLYLRAAHLHINIVITHMCGINNCITLTLYLVFRSKDSVPWPQLLRRT